MATKIGVFRAGYPLAHLSRPEHGFWNSRFDIACLSLLRNRCADRFPHHRIVLDRRKLRLAEIASLRWLEVNGVVLVMASAPEGRKFADVKILAGWLRLAIEPVRLCVRSNVGPCRSVPFPTCASTSPAFVERPMSVAGRPHELVGAAEIGSSRALVSLHLADCRYFRRVGMTSGSSCTNGRLIAHCRTLDGVSRASRECIGAQVDGR